MVTPASSNVETPPSEGFKVSSGVSAMAKAPFVDYKTKAKNLKSLGLINIDLRRTITPAVKGQITRKINSLGDNYKALAAKPESFVKVIAPSKRIANNMVEAGYVAAGRKVYIPKKPGFRDYKFTGDTLTYKQDTADKKFYYEIKNFFPGTADFFEFSKKLRDGKIKLKKGEVFTLKIGANSPFSRSYFTSHKDFVPYLNLMMQGTTLKESTFAEILPHIQFVKLVKRK
jgi:hypothetical protein